MRKTLALLVLAAVLIVPLLAITTAPAQATEDGQDKISLCHAHPADTGASGYVLITIDLNGEGGDEQVAHHANEHDADIIPPHGDFAGKNWTEEGQAIFNDDCGPPPKPVYRLVVDCDGWKVFSDQQDGAVDSGSWIKPFELETASSQYIDELIREPSNCLVEIKLVNTCEGWFIYRTDQDGKLDSGIWDDPYALEQATSQYVDFVIHEPEECLRHPDEVVVGVDIACDRAAGDGVVYQAIAFLSISDPGGATLTFDGNDYTESQPVYVGFGSYDWTAQAADGFTLVGDESGTVKIDGESCNVPHTGGPGDLITEPMALIGMGAIGLAAISAGAYGLWKRERVQQ